MEIWACKISCKKSLYVIYIVTTWLGAVVIGSVGQETFAQAPKPLSSSEVLHELTFQNTSLLPTRGLVKFGLAFEKGDIPRGYIPHLRTTKGSHLRSCLIESATWSDGSLRKAIIVADLGMIAKSSSTEIEVISVAGIAATSMLDPFEHLASMPEDLTLEITSRSGSTSGPLSDLHFSLRAASAVETRAEVQANTELFVRFFCWEKAPGEEHLLCMHYVDFWLDTDGSVLGVQWTPVLSQHWWVSDPFGVPSQKQEYTYDCSVKHGSKTIDSHAGLAHAYYCRWASLDVSDNEQHATPHWLVGTVPKPTTNIQYSVASRMKLARLGYVPPLDWESAGWDVSTEKTYRPLECNGHRRIINDVGGYIGRGAVTKPDANAIAVQSPDAWRRARVSAHAGLSVFFHKYDHRVIDIERSPRLIPNKLIQKGPQNYSHLGSEVFHAQGKLGIKLDIAEEVADGGTGAFVSYDSAHHVNYSAFMAFITGERYLFDCIYGQFETATTFSHINKWGHIPYILYAETPRGEALGIPKESFGVMSLITQQRAKGWYANALLWTWAMLPDDDAHYEYLRNCVDDFGNWLKASLSFFPDDNLAYGCFDSSGNKGVLVWMQNFGPICIYPWLTIIEDQELGSGGYRQYCDIVVRMLVNCHRSGRLYASGAYINVLPSDRDAMHFIEGELDLFVHISAEYSEGVFTASPPYAAMPWSEGDKVIFAGVNGNNVVIQPPADFSITERYYMTNVNGNKFQLTSTLDGAAINFSGTGNTSLWISAASWSKSVAGIYRTPIPGSDSYFAIAGAAIAAAYVGRNPEVTAGVHEDFMIFLSKVKRAAFPQWNYTGIQSASR